MPSRLSRTMTLAGMTIGIVVIAGSIVGGVALAANGSDDPVPGVATSTSAGPHPEDANASHDGQDDATEHPDGNDATENEDGDDADDHGSASDPTASPTAHDDGDDHHSGSDDPTDDGH